MTASMTFTEFNRNRSQAMRAARRGEDVVVHSGREGGGDAVLITRLGKTLSPLAQGLADGTIRPPRTSLDAPFTPAHADPQRAAAALAEFETEREG